MLKHDKYKLVIVLSILFSNLNYFKFKKDGTIIAKRRWYSLKRAVFNLQELAAVEIPTIIGKISEKAAAHYSAQISAEFNTPGPISNLITAMHQHVTALQPMLTASKTTKQVNSPFGLSTPAKVNEVKQLEKPKKVVAKTIKEKPETPNGYVMVGKIYNTVDSALNSKYREIVRHLNTMEGRYCLA